MRVEEGLRRDLREAVRVEANERAGRLTLVGPLWRPAAAGDPQHLPARVEYRLENHDGVGGVLVREQRALLGRSNRDVTRRVLAGGVQDWRVRRERERGLNPARPRENIRVALRGPGDERVEVREAMP